MEEVRKLIDKLHKTGSLGEEEFEFLLDNRNEEDSKYLFELARKTADSVYGKRVFLRGLIEFTNYCKNDCFYCGIRNGNGKAERYRLTKDEIMMSCEFGYEHGIRTFVLQGGEDPYFDDDTMCDIVSTIRKKYPDCAITLSIGERSRDSYERLYEAGADRYLLRHETATEEHYRKLHPPELSMKERMQCLKDLKEIGFQVGAGFMVGAPYQTHKDMARDFVYLKELEPEMIGIGPFIHHEDTPFADMPDGTAEETIYCLGLLRLMLPKALIPATTALGTIDPEGREKGILAGANVIMPSISPSYTGGKYLLYKDKLKTSGEMLKGPGSIENKMRKIGYETVTARGDCAGWERR